MAEHDQRVDAAPDDPVADPGDGSGTPTDGSDDPRGPAGVGDRAPEGGAPPEPDDLPDEIDDDGPKPDVPPTPAEPSVDVPGGGGGGGGGGSWSIGSVADDVVDAAGDAYEDTVDAAETAADDVAGATSPDRVEDTVQDTMHDPLGTAAAGNDRLSDHLEDGNDAATDGALTFGALVDDRVTAGGDAVDDLVDPAMEPLGDAYDGLGDAADPVEQGLDLPDVRDPATWYEAGDRLEPVYTPVEDIVNDLPGALRDANEDVNTGIDGTQGVLDDVNDELVHQVDAALDTPAGQLAVEFGAGELYPVVGDAYQTYLLGRTAVEYGSGAVDAADEALDDAGITGGGGGGDQGDRAPGEPTDPLDRIDDVPWDAATEVSDQAGSEALHEADGLLADAFDDPGTHLPPLDDGFDVGPDLATTAAPDGAGGFDDVG